VYVSHSYFTICLGTIRIIKCLETENLYGYAGLNRNDLKIELSEGRLTVLKRGASSPSAAETSTTPAAEEWTRIGSYELPEDAINDSMYARLADGELFISVQRTPKVKPTQICATLWPVERNEVRPTAQEK
jgi:hypothetical protein